MLPLSNILARKVRTAISVLAIGVGVALFLVLVGLTSMLREIANRATNVDAHLMVLPSGGPALLIGGGLPADKIEAKLRAIPGVSAAIPVLCWSLNMAGRDQNAFGIRPEDWHFFAGPDRIVEGRPLAGGMEMLVDTRLAAAGHISVGDVVERLDHKFTVVGIAREGVAGRVFLPIDALNECLQNDTRRATFFYVKAAGPESVEPVRKAVEDAKLKAFTLDEYYARLANLMGDMHLVIGAVVVVAGFVCFLVILLTVYTMVVERTREMGILKGIGASRVQIFGLVMAEAGLILVGGILAGFALTVGGRLLILHLQPLWTIDIPAVRFAYAALLATGGTILGALHPALKAASQDPVESLRYE
ncbi:MAG: ABC transporter permease [Planctomycetota bacterium]|nr:ABC transporter permease [Planctomycetota bacterium]